MSSQKKISPLYSLMLTLLVPAVLGAFFLSASALIENFRFANGVHQILQFVKTVRSFSERQRTFTLSSGEDVWATMVRVGQISERTEPINPWNGDFMATAIDNKTLRIETVLPTHSCRRLVLYVLKYDPANTGILSVEARPDFEHPWALGYTAASGQPSQDPESICDGDRYAILGLSFALK